MHSLNTRKQFLLLFLSLGLWLFLIYIYWLATPSQLLFIGSSGLDKVAHIGGGLFIALLVEWQFKPPRLTRLLTIILGLALGWEVQEFLFDADTRFFYFNAFDLWFLDSLGDAIAAFLGGYGYWVFGMNRNPEFHP